MNDLGGRGNDLKGRRGNGFTDFNMDIVLIVLI